LLRNVEIVSDKNKTEKQRQRQKQKQKQKQQKQKQNIKATNGFFFAKTGSIGS
jgi:hypothetical protein